VLFLPRRIVSTVNFSRRGFRAAKSDWVRSAAMPAEPKLLQFIESVICRPRHPGTFLADRDFSGLSSFKQKGNHYVTSAAVPAGVR
jgi:hypothetical protein